MVPLSPSWTIEGNQRKPRHGGKLHRKAHTELNLESSYSEVTVVTTISPYCLLVKSLYQFKLSNPLDPCEVLYRYKVLVTLCGGMC